MAKRFPSEIPYASLLVYSVSGSTDVSRASRTKVRDRVKRGKRKTLERVALRVDENLAALEGVLRIGRRADPHASELAHPSGGPVARPADVRGAPRTPPGKLRPRVHREGARSHQGCGHSRPSARSTPPGHPAARAAPPPTAPAAHRRRRRDIGQYPVRSLRPLGVVEGERSGDEPGAPLAIGLPLSPIIHDSDSDGTLVSLTADLGIADAAWDAP